MRFLFWLLSVLGLGWPVSVPFIVLFGGTQSTFAPAITVGYGITGTVAWWAIYRRPAIADKRESLERKERETAQAVSVARVRASMEDIERAAEAKRAVEKRAADVLSIEALSAVAVERYNQLPELLDATRNAENEALRLFDEGVYSPFWTEIERAYEGAAQYNANISAIQAAAERHGNLSRRYVQEYSSPNDLSLFPIDLNAALATAAINSVATHLGEMVYKAHHIPEYSQIWEQRRTTRVISIGFANLEQATSQMESALRGSVAALTREINDMTRLNVRSSGAVVEAIGAVNDAAALFGKPTYAASAGALNSVREAARLLESKPS